MTTHQLDDLFHRAAALPPAQWKPFLDRVCGHDATLRQTLLAMLSSRSAAYEWFDQAEGTLGLFWEAAIPLMLGPYRILRRLGAGGMGTVYLAEQQTPHGPRHVAIKCMKWEAEELLTRFLDERRILSRLEHPAVVRYLDSGRTETGEPYLVMEYVPGEPLTAWLQRGQTRNECLRLFAEISEALEHAHLSQVVHRDLKMSNILVTADGHPKLLDFGIAKLLDRPRDSDGPGPLTPVYAAPEQLEGGDITPLTDIYQLGGLLAAMLTGHPPGDLARICERAQARRPEDRYPSVAALLTDLRNAR
jgi:eukaryotic-like serine/threonine-protein kinase